MNPEQDIPYSPDTASVLDFYPPTVVTREPAPVIVYAHGGGFTGGVETIDPDANPWAGYRAAGYAVASVRYALAPGCHFLTSPSQPADLGKAIQFLRWKSDRFNIDPGAVVLHGNSAGAIIGSRLVYGPDLADAASSREIDHESTRPQAFVCQVGLTDFRDAHPLTPKLGGYFGVADDLALVPLATLEQASACWLIEQPGAALVPAFGVYSAAPPDLNPPVSDPHNTYWGIKLDAALHAADPATKSQLWSGGVSALWAQMPTLLDWVEDVIG